MGDHGGDSVEELVQRPERPDPGPRRLGTRQGGADELRVDAVREDVQHLSDDVGVGEVRPERDEHAGAPWRGGRRCHARAAGVTVRFGPERPSLDARRHGHRPQSVRADVQEPPAGRQCPGRGETCRREVRCGAGRDRAEELRRRVGPRRDGGQRPGERRRDEHADQVEHLVDDQVRPPGTGRLERVGRAQVETGSGEELRDGLRRRFGAGLLTGALGDGREQDVGHRPGGQVGEAFGLRHRRQPGRGEQRDVVTPPRERAGQREEGVGVPERRHRGEQEPHIHQNILLMRRTGFQRAQRQGFNRAAAEHGHRAPRSK